MSMQFLVVPSIIQMFMSVCV